MGETGASRPWVNFNVALAANMLREVASFVTQINGQVHTSEIPGCLSMSVRQPVGVVLGIAPWNAPVILAIRAIAAPLACGNTVILKASEISPGTQALLGKVFADAGFPPGVVNVISNAPADAGKIVEALIAHPAVRRVNFTGSTRVGRIIAETAGRHLKPVLLELGGKAPLLVLDDADLDQAVNAAAFGAFVYQGQVCMSTERVVVDKKVADDFVAKFAAKAQSLPAGNPRNGNIVLGPMIGVESAERVEGLVKDAVAKGAKLAAGGQREGSIMAATVLDFVTPQMRIYSENHWPGRLRRAREHRRGRHPDRQRYGIRAFVRGLRPRRQSGAERRQADRIRHLPYQRADGPGRGADAVRRHESQRLWPLQRSCRHQRIHRAALDHDRDRTASLSVLTRRQAAATIGLWRTVMNIPLAHPQLSEAASKFLAGKHQAFIGGKWVDAVFGKTFDTFDPGTGRVIAQVAECDAPDVDKAVAAAARRSKVPGAARPEATAPA